MICSITNVCDNTFIQCLLFGSSCYTYLQSRSHIKSTTSLTGTECQRYIVLAHYTYANMSIYTYTYRLEGRGMHVGHLIFPTPFATSCTIVV